MQRLWDTRDTPRCSVDRRSTAAAAVHPRYLGTGADGSANVPFPALSKLAFLPVSVPRAASCLLDPGDCPAGEEKVHN